jgi:hypothetical protein
MYQHTGPYGDYTTEQMQKFYQELALCFASLGGDGQDFLSEPPMELFNKFLYFQMILVRKDQINKFDRKPIVVVTSSEELDPYAFEFAYQLMLSRQSN